MAGIDLLSGKVHGIVADRHRSREFIAFLQELDRSYPPAAHIRLVLGNHSAHISKETRAFLATTPNRFEFIFTPKHGSWLNLVESFFGKMARTMLRGIRVSSKAELQEWILLCLAEVNASPVVYRWKYKAGLDGHPRSWVAAPQELHLENPRLNRPVGPEPKRTSPRSTRIAASKNNVTRMGRWKLGGWPVNRVPYWRNMPVTCCLPRPA